MKLKYNLVVIKKKKNKLETTNKDKNFNLGHKLSK